ncbi:MAG: YdcF family protein, partial [Arenicellales bacterium]
MPDWITLSKFLPQLVYPFNLALLLLLAALLLIIFGRRRSGVFAVFLAFVVLAVCASPLSLVLYRQHELQHPPVPVPSSPTADAIVLLGGDVGIPVPPRMESQLHGNRLLHAFRLFEAGKAPLIIVTGGNVFPQEGLDVEAAYSKTILVGWGVPDDVILTETKSRNTRQNALFS